MSKSIKRLLSLLAVVAMVLSMLPTSFPHAHAEELTEPEMFETTDYTYTVANGEATITGYTGAGGDITIPSELGGYPVTTIGDYAFAFCDSLTSVIIPDSVTTIGGLAFAYCDSLTSVTIGDSVTTIGEDAFYDCSSLTSVTIPDSVTFVDEYAFYGCESLTDVYYTGTEEQWNEITIGEYNEYLLNATIHFAEEPEEPTEPTEPEPSEEPTEPSEEPTEPTETEPAEPVVETCPGCGADVVWTEMDQEAFLSLDEIDTIKILPTGHYRLTSSISYDMKRTFVVQTDEEVCLDLNGFDINNTSTDSGAGTIVCAGTLNMMGNGNVTCATPNKEGSTSGAIIANGGTVDLYGGTYCAENGFATLNTNNGGTLNVHEGVTVSKGYLVQLTGSNVLNITGGTFRSTFRIKGDATKVTVSGGTFTANPSVYVVEGYTAKANDNGTWTVGVWTPDSDYTYTVENGEAIITGYTGAGGNITIPSELDGYPVTTIDDYAFYFCDSLTSVTIGDNVTTIGDSAFEECYSLSSVIIPDGVITIGSSAFNWCTGLNSVIIGNGVTTIGRSAFYWCTSLTSVTIGNSVTTIGEWAFASCESLTSITIPDSVTTIGDCAFTDCSSLTSVIIPDSVTTIGDLAFADCASLTSVTIGNGVTTIGDSAFGSCDSLTSVTIPENVITIGDDAFAGCDGLTGIWVSENNANYSSDSIGVLFNKDKTEMIQVPGAISGSYTIPDGVTTMGDRAFYDCGGLTNVTIPAGITTIRNYTFYNCGSLTGVTIPDSVTFVDEYAFDGCQSLTDVYFTGSRVQWSEITVVEGNEELLAATIHCAVEHAFDQTTVCEHCGVVPADGWKAILDNSVTQITGAGHYYMAYEWEKSSKGGLIMPAYDVCINLNYYSIKGTSANGRALTISGGQTVNLMGQGTVVTTGTQGAIYCIDGTVNLYGGTYNAPAGEKVLYATGTAATINVFGGTYAGDLYVVNDAALSIFGGTFNADPSAYVAEGYEAIKTGSVWTVSAKPEMPAVCPGCGETVTEWTAVSTYAGDNGWTPDMSGHYYLANDISSTSKRVFSFPAGTDVCLYLNGKSITSNATLSSAITLRVFGTLRLMGEGTVSAGYNTAAMAPVVAYTGGSVEIYGGTYVTNTAEPVLRTSGGTFTVYGGTFDTDPGTYVAPGYVATENADGTWTVIKDPFADKVCVHCGVAPKDGWTRITTNTVDEITADGHYVLACDWSKSHKYGMHLPAYNICLDLNGHSIDGLYSNGRAITVSGGQTVNLMGQGNVTTIGTGGAIYCSNGTVNLYGGTYNAPAGKKVVSVYVGSTINIYGGTVNGGFNVGGTLSITDGAFSEDPSAFVVDGKHALANAEGMYTISNCSSVALDAVAPDCENTGLTAGEKCAECGKILTAQEEIPALGHTEGAVVVENEVAPDYNNEGSYDNVVYCTVCNKELSRETVTVPALTGAEAQIGTTKYGTLAKAIEAAEAGQTVELLKGFETNALVAISKSITLNLGENNITRTTEGDGAAAILVRDGANVTITGTGTVTANGGPAVWAYSGNVTIDGGNYVGGNHAVYASGTSKVVINGGKFANTLVGQYDYVLNILDKDRATCTITVNGGEFVDFNPLKNGAEGANTNFVAEGLHASADAEGVYKIHTCIIEILEAVAPECVNSGLTEGKKCTGCGEILVMQEVIPALGHTEEELAAVAPDCANAGLTAGVKCSVCGEILTAQEEIPALGHTEEIVPGYAPALNVPGLTEGKKCTVCGEITVPQEEIPALTGAAMVNGVGYETLAEAVAAAGANDIITLYADVDADEMVIVKKPMTIKFNGFTITEDNIACTKYTNADGEKVVLACYEVSEGLIIKAAQLTAEELGKAVAYVDLNGDKIVSPGEEATTLQAALDAAAATGQTVRLTDDLTLNSTIFIPGGVTLDIQANAVTIKTLIGLNGSKLRGDVFHKTKAYGQLFVDPANLVLAAEGVASGTPYEPGNYARNIPVRNGNHFVFSSMQVDTDQSYDANRGLVIDEAAKTIRFQFNLNMSSRVRSALLNNGTADNELKVVIRLQWTAGEGVAYQDFVYDSEFVADVCTDDKLDFYFFMEGYDVLNITAENLTVTGMVITNSGVEVSGINW